MPLPSSRSVPYPPPSRADAVALAVVVGYLTRAGTHAASRLLLLPSNQDAAALVAGLRDRLLADAALCNGSLDLTPERPVAFVER